MKPLRALLVVISMFLLSGAALAQKGTVTCKDGTKSSGGRGACSSHGGIAAKAKAATKADVKATTKAEAKPAAKAEKPAAKAEKPAAKAEKAEKAEKAAAKPAATAEESDPKGAIAECKDHTYSHAKTHQGACSRHGGVAKWMDKKGE
jgi:uncharacterized membrane protein